MLFEMEALDLEVITVRKQILGINNIVVDVFAAVPLRNLFFDLPVRPFWQHWL